MNTRKRLNQKTRVYQSLRQYPKTRLQVALELNILRGNVCYFIREFRKADRVSVYRVGRDPITGHKAEFLTTDPSLFPVSNQLELLK